MKQNVKIALCAALAVFAALCLGAVLLSFGARPADAAGERYLLREMDGRVAVFYPADAGEPAMITDIRLRDLPLGDRLELTAGVSVSDYTAVARLLEDYGA